jgi:hypothetical protein
VGLAVAVGLGAGLGPALGVGPGWLGAGEPDGVLPGPGWQGAPSIVQSAGTPAGPPEPDVTNPTSADPPGWMAPSQPALVTVTSPLLTVWAPFHRLVIEVPAGSRKPSVQPVVAAPPSLVIVYWPV